MSFLAWILNESHLFSIVRQKILILAKMPEALRIKVVYDSQGFDCFLLSEVV